VLWIDLGDVVSSASTVTAPDCRLHLVGTDFGAVVAVEPAPGSVLGVSRSGQAPQSRHSPKISTVWLRSV